MKHLLPLLLALCLQTATAQNTLKSIRERYAAQKEYIATHTGDNQYDGAEWGNYYSLKVRQWLPATGGHIEDIRMYYDEEEPDEDSDVVYPPHYLTFLTTRYNFAAREFYEEYLYDPDGEPAFIFNYDPMTTFVDGEPDREYEVRIYLNKGKLLNAIIKHKGEGDADFVVEFQGSTLPVRYSMMLPSVLQRAASLRELFVDIDRVTYPY